MQNIWIFQLESPLSEDQKATLNAGLGVFVRDAWKAHGAPVPGVMEIRHDRFLIIQAEPGSTSGCSIDSMTKTATEAITAVGARKLESNFVVFQSPDGKISHIDFREIPQALADGRLSPDSTIFNAALQPGEPLENFEIPLHQSWMKRFLTPAR